MFKTFMILKYFHIQTSAIQRKYPTLIVRIFLVSVRTHSISRYIHIQTLCVHKQNVLRFLQHGTYHVVVRGGLHFCQSPKGGGSGVFLLKRKGGPTLFWEKKCQNSPAPPPPQRKNVPSLTGPKMPRMFSGCYSLFMHMWRCQLSKQWFNTSDLCCCVFVDNTPRCTL